MDNAKFVIFGFELLVGIVFWPVAVSIYLFHRSYSEGIAIYTINRNYILLYFNQVRIFSEKNVFL